MYNYWGGGGGRGRYLDSDRHDMLPCFKLFVRCFGWLTAGSLAQLSAHSDVLWNSSIHIYVCCIGLIVFQCFNNFLNAALVMSIFMYKLIWPCCLIRTIAVWEEMHQFVSHNFCVMPSVTWSINWKHWVIHTPICFQKSIKSAPDKRKYLNDSNRTLWKPNVRLFLWTQMQNHFNGNYKSLFCYAVQVQYISLCL